MKEYEVELNGVVVRHAKVIEDDDKFVLVPVQKTKDGDIKYDYTKPLIYAKKEPEYPLEQVIVV